MVGMVYLVTLLALYPAMPITEGNADTDLSEIYAQTYPPFRMDENNYYTIAQNIIQGNVYRDGSVERSFSIGFPLVTVPFILIWGKLGCYLANLAIILLSIFFFYLILRRYASPIKSSLMALLLAFTTVDLFYALSAYTEPLAQLFILAGFYSLVRSKNTRWENLGFFISGAVIALNLFVRVHYVLLVLPFFLFSWTEWKKKFIFHHRAFWLIGGAVCITALWLVRNALVFGSPFSFEYSRMFGRFIGGSTQYSGNLFWGLHELLFDMLHGLLTISPILLLFPAGLTIMWRKGEKNDMLIILFSVSIMVLVFAISPYPFTEFGLGSRHMVPIIPLILLPAVFLLDSLLSHRIIITLLALYSFYYAGLGWFTGGGGEYIGNRGFFVGLLHSKSSETILLERKNLLPRKTFSTRQELTDTFNKGYSACDYQTLFSTLNPKVIENIRGHEREFMTYIRQYARPESLITTVDPKEGIMFRPMQFGSQVK
jgi:hypothetical protein